MGKLINLVGNGLSRKLQLFFDSEPEHTSKRIKISNKKVTKNKRREIEISPNSYTINDTTKINSRRYRIHKFNKAYFWLQKQRSPINSVALLFLISNLKKAYLLIIRIIQVQILLVNLFLVNIQIFLMEV